LYPLILLAERLPELIGSYNALVLDRNRILKSATEVNPTVIKMNEQFRVKIKCRSKFESYAIQFKDSKKNLNNKERGDKW
jgi:hypothetical protein